MFEPVEEDVHDVLGSIAIATMSYQAPSFTLFDPSDLAKTMTAILIHNFPEHWLQFFSTMTADLACLELVHEHHTVWLREHVENLLVRAGRVELACR